MGMWRGIETLQRKNAGKKKKKWHGDAQSRNVYKHRKLYLCMERRTESGYVNLWLYNNSGYKRRSDGLGWRAGRRIAAQRAVPARIEKWRFCIFSSVPPAARNISGGLLRGERPSYGGAETSKKGDSLCDIIVLTYHRHFALGARCVSRMVHQAEWADGIARRRAISARCHGDIGELCYETRQRRRAAGAKRLLAWRVL
jgi:hypothetical protein